MLEVGLTGGIGSGKSMVAVGLVSRGAVLIDADAIVRELQEPGQAVYREIVDRFGTAVIDDDERLDRGALAAIVFADPDELAALNDIVHPAVGKEIERRRAEASETDAVVIYDIPLLIDADGERKSHYDHLTAIVVVDVDPAVAVERLVKFRGFDAADAWARISNQASREARLAHADFVVDNSGERDAINPQLDACWEWLLSHSA